ncbi:heparan-alpha-glucosaminide N-acetyltransferase domain-containing protein [Psychroflexus sp. CAK57W]|uniref:DUF1624 domain-containing protein n=1 Tax=Psychroflexus curvus TaxID=2873595 RepID=UPI001CCE034F|nr:heparan-alpha-glucosaminide N-acetyltransferase domain-containing protein [Psychroflexus curvus]MBZ9788419.1 heparan-alpha-glucosaminide N-acetyltransferase domain-containing protein [Psychroflexus curvus]
MSKTNHRVQSLDFLKGLVILLMALDHVRDYFHKDVFYFEPTDIEQTHLALFFTRFITHFCAPVFVLLAGTSAFFVQQRMLKFELSQWLVKRGLWLVFVEVIIITFGWRFQLNFDSIVFQVIWLLGISMVFLAVFIHVPKKLMIASSLIVIFGHNSLDGITGGQFSDIWTLLHVQGPILLSEDTVLFNVYPLIPWIFVMPLGYHLGGLYTSAYDAKARRQLLIYIGLAAIGLFFGIRAINIYGNLTFWTTYEDFGKTLMSFFNVSKYPPSLLYLLITLGPSMILLAWAEHFKGKLYTITVLFGKVPMFFYIIHIYYIHLLAVIAAYLTGYDPSLMIVDVWISFETGLQGYGFSLGVVYLVWLFVAVTLYPVCVWYWNYKKTHRHHWWLSYV